MNHFTDKNLIICEIGLNHLGSTKWSDVMLHNILDSEVDAVETLAHLFMNKYGKYNYVAKLENKELIKFQKSEVFTTPEKAYKNAGVELVNYDEYY